MQPIVKATLIGLLCMQAGFAFAQERDDVIAQAPGGFSLHGHIYHKHFKDEVPPASGYVTDWEDLYTDAQELKLDSLISAFDKKTGIQIAVVTIDSSMADRADFDSITLKIANSWGVGQAANKGVVIGISNILGIMRIQTGTGLDSVLSDADTQKIVNTDFLPSFEKGQYYQGTWNGLEALMGRLEGK
jgi:uncharacterized protein